MAIKIKNDEGRTVPAVGAPGSIERIKCERPGLIKLIQRDIDSKIVTFRLHNSELELRNLLIAALEKYIPEIKKLES